MDESSERIEEHMDPQVPAERVPGRGVTYGELPWGGDSLGSRHMLLIDQMISWQIANPGKPYTQMAQALGLSTQWVRMVAGTDAYKARAAKCGDMVFRELGIQGLKEKLSQAAQAAVDRMAQKIEFAESLPEITDATEVLLDAHYKLSGTAGDMRAGQTVNVQTNVILQGREALLNGTTSEVRPQVIEAKE